MAEMYLRPRIGTTDYKQQTFEELQVIERHLRNKLAERCEPLGDGYAQIELRQMITTDIKVTYHPYGEIYDNGAKLVDLVTGERLHGKHDVTKAVAKSRISKDWNRKSEGEIIKPKRKMDDIWYVPMITVPTSASFEINAGYTQKLEETILQEPEVVYTQKDVFRHRGTTTIKCDVDYFEQKPCAWRMEPIGSLHFTREHRSRNFEKRFVKDHFKPKFEYYELCDAWEDTHDKFREYRGWTKTGIGAAIVTGGICFLLGGCAGYAIQKTLTKELPAMPVATGIVAAALTGFTAPYTIPTALTPLVWSLANTYKLTKFGVQKAYAKIKYGHQNLREHAVADAKIKEHENFVLENQSSTTFLDAVTKPLLEEK